MDAQEYLNQISNSTRPTKKSSPSFFSSTIFKILLAAVGVIILIMISGTIITSIKSAKKNDIISLKLHLDNLSSTISEYQPYVKSSSLRSSSASLSSIVSSTNTNLTTYLTEVYEFNANKVDTKLSDAETELSDELNNDLFEAKINALLDRTYAHKMAYEISILISRENSIINSTSNTTLKSDLTSSRTSLETLYENFNSFSETK